MGAINSLIAFVGVFQTIAIGRIFGASREIEVFFAACTLQATLQQLTASGQVSGIFVPLFHELKRNTGIESARQAASAMANSMVLLVLPIAAVSMLFSESLAGLLVPGYSAADKLLCSSVFFWIAPLIVIGIVAGFCGEILRAEQQFLVNETAALIARILNLGILLVFGLQLGIWALVCGLWTGAIIQLLVRATVLLQKGYRHRFLIKTTDFNPMTVVVRLSYSLTHMFANQFATFAITAAFSNLGEGPYAIFRYAKQLHGKVQGMILQPVGVVFFHTFSDSAEANREKSQLARQALDLSLALVALYTVAQCVAGDLLLTALFASENFTLTQLGHCHWLMIGFALLLVMNAQYSVAQRANLASQIIFRQFFSTAIVVLLAGVASFWVIPAMGLWGGLLIQVCSVTACALVSLIILANYGPGIDAKISIGRWGKWLVAVGLTSATFWVLRSVANISLDANRGQLLFTAGMFAGGSVIMCGLISLQLGLPEGKWVLKYFIQRITPKDAGA